MLLAAKSALGSAVVLVVVNLAYRFPAGQEVVSYFHWLLSASETRFQ